MSRVTPDSRDRAFKAAVRTHVRRRGRSFPWRETTNPYRILVSEVMLQQTQTHRVVPKYRSFLKRFPTLRSLADAPLGDVLREWSGLGYNRRAKMLHACAKKVVTKHRGIFPKTYEELLSLPGVGPYTAGAVLAFAFNTPRPLIETNIRTVFLFHYFPGKEGVADAELMTHIERTLDHREPRLWYNALMDYGAWIKETYGNHNARSRGYTKQSTFKGSARELRGKILRAVHTEGKTASSLKQLLDERVIVLTTQLEALVREGMLIKKGRHYELPN